MRAVTSDNACNSGAGVETEAGGDEGLGGASTLTGGAGREESSRSGDAICWGTPCASASTLEMADDTTCVLSDGTATQGAMSKLCIGRLKINEHCITPWFRRHDDIRTYA